MNEYVDEKECWRHELVEWTGNGGCEVMISIGQRRYLEHDALCHTKPMYSADRHCDVRRVLQTNDCPGRSDQHGLETTKQV